MSEYLIPLDAIWMARLQDPFFWILTAINIFICAVVLYGAYKIWRERNPIKQSRAERRFK